MSESTSGPTEQLIEVNEITRTFAAPRGLVWRAWTEPERLAQWWGAAGSTIQVAALDLRPGGMFLYQQSSPEGFSAWGRFLYRDVTPPERLEFVTSFTDDQGNIIRAPFSETWPLEILNTVTFTEQDGRTTMTMRGGPINASAAELAQFAEFRPMVTQGLIATLDQLDAYLARA